MSDIKITEDTGSDISTIIGHYAVIDENVRHGNTPKGSVKVCDTWSCFDGLYERGKEREFIKAIDFAYPGKYKHFHISWVNCN